jgi:Zn-dependent protease with chaperone function
MNAADLPYVMGLYYDGQHPKARPAHLALAGIGSEQVLHLRLTAAFGEEAHHHQGSYPLAEVDLGEPTAQATRLIRFAQGGHFQAHDGQQLNDYLAAHAHAGGWVSRITLNWNWVAGACAGTAALVAAFYVWGIPAAAKVVAPLVPDGIRQTIGEQAFEQLDKLHFKPSTIPQAEQAVIRQRWAAFLARQPQGAHIPAHTLHFRSMVMTLDRPDAQGNMSPTTVQVPNAMALPNGAIVLTDGLLTLLADQPDAVMGVLAHELGHLEHQHSMRMLVEVSALSGLSAIVLGDATGLITQIPLLMGALSYSREHETEADDQAIAMMRAGGIAPAQLAVFFERARAFMAAQTSPKNKPEPASPLNLGTPDWLSSHPSDAARIAKLKRS